MGDAAMNFSRFARTVTVIVPSESLKSTLSHYLVVRINAAGNIKVLCNTEVTGLRGDQFFNP